ncbi:MAG TPA: D-aminoacyl-tRNA deacylase [Longilinea sp.]|nr:D-aminoacyl-tRNA deacylase [Longilinea sp.]
MRAVVQRVTHGKVSVDGHSIAEIGPGLVILLGIGPNDDEEKARSLGRKIALLRIFADAEGKMNRSCVDISGQAIVVSQFTLYADTRRGNRPSFIEAAPPDLARPLCDRFSQLLIEAGIPTQQGEFGANMRVQIENDGPVTILFEI